MSHPTSAAPASCATPVSDELRASGYWNPEWDSFAELDPLWTEKFLDMAMHPMTKGLIEPKVWEFISIAVDASCTHMYGPGTRRHIRKALELGEGRPAGFDMDTARARVRALSSAGAGAGGATKP